MKKKLFLEAFKKAEQQSGSTTKNGIATYLEQVFEEKLGFTVNRITFSRYYEKFVEQTNNHSMNPKGDLLNHLAKFMGCDSYEDFVKKNELQRDESTGESFVDRMINFIKIHKYHIILIVLSIMLIVYTVYEFTKKRWMVWNGYSYEEVDFDIDKYDFNQLKLYDHELATKFKRILVDCDTTTFYKPDGSANIWYGKNHKKELQYFTLLNHHPETGKALRPITDYMINHNICHIDSLSKSTNN